MAKEMLLFRPTRTHRTLSPDALLGAKASLRGAYSSPLTYEVVGADKGSSRYFLTPVVTGSALTQPDSAEEGAELPDTTSNRTKTVEPKCISVCVNAARRAYSPGNRL